MEPFIKLAVAQTIVDTLALLVELRATATKEQQRRIDDMIGRLTVMMQTAL